MSARLRELLLSVVLLALIATNLWQTRKLIELRHSLEARLGASGASGGRPCVQGMWLDPGQSCTVVITPPAFTPAPVDPGKPL